MSSQLVQYSIMKDSAKCGRWDASCRLLETPSTTVRKDNIIYFIIIGLSYGDLGTFDGANDEFLVQTTSPQTMYVHW